MGGADASRLDDNEGLPGSPEITAWVVIRVTASLVRDPLWSRFVAIVVWVIAALSILNLLAPAMATLDSVAITLGGPRISALRVVEAVLSLALLLWIATLVGHVLEPDSVAKPTPPYAPAVREWEKLEQFVDGRLRRE